MEVTLLGTGAPLCPGRATMGVFVTAPGCAPLLIDTCGGMEIARQLDAVGCRLDEIENVVLTHRHLDHAGGIPALLLARRPIVLYANADAQAGAAALMQAVFPEWGSGPAATHPVVDRDCCEIGGFEVELFAVDHRVPTLAVRVSAGGRSVAFSADSLPCAALVDCARGADLFLCDAIAGGGQGEEIVRHVREIMHPTAAEAAEMATRAEVGALALVHIGRFADTPLMLEEASSGFAGPLTMPDDGQRYVV